MSELNTPPPVRTLISLALVSSLLVACGGGGGKAGTTKAQAIQTITAYADDASNPAPTLQDYIDAGVTGVTDDNLSQLNNVVEGLVAEDVDTTEELDALSAALGVNIKPTANAGEDITAQVNQSVHLIGSGADPDGTIASYQWLKDGTELATTAEYDYTPTAAGTDTLTLTVTDNDGATATDTIEITVTVAPVANQAPSANNGSTSLAEDTTKEITLTASDANGDTLSYTKVSDPAHGTVTIAGNKATYTPTANYNGSDSFTFKANDGTVDSNVATVNITVTAVNDAPVANAVNAATPENTVKAITLDATDLDADTLSYTKVSDPAHGTVSISGNTATYTPTANYSGADSFTYKANDGSSDSNTATVTINVSSTNDAPTANAGADVSVIEGQTILLNGSGSDPDAGDTLSYSWSPSANLNSSSVAQPSYTAPSVNSDTNNVLTLTVTDTGGLTDTSNVTVTVLNLPAQPQSPQAVAGSSEAVVSWNSVADATAYDICYSTTTIANPIACTAAGETLLSNQTSSTTIASLSNGTPYYFVVIPKNPNGKGVPSAEVTATPAAVPATANATGKLNDTGITTCGNYPFASMSPIHSNTESCANTTDANGEPIPPGQDGHSDTPFDFTKLDAAGVPLADQTQDYATNSWSCVKDETTGLIWEVKTPYSDPGIHSRGNLYTWYNPDNTKNGGDVGTPSVTGDDTHSFVTAVNNAGLCGATNWRMPTDTELLSLVSLKEFTGTYIYTIDANYFPHIGGGGVPLSPYWSSVTWAFATNKARTIFFYNSSGRIVSKQKSDSMNVRLVRSQ